MRLTDRFEEARRTHDIFSILGTRKKSIVCPLPMHIHASNTASFSIYSEKGYQHFKCHGNCGAEGDVVDLVGYMRIPGYDPYSLKMRTQALALLDERYDPVIVRIEKPVVLTGCEWVDYLPPSKATLEYAQTRGLDYNTLLKFRVGTKDHYMTMPCFHEGQLMGIKLRNIDSADHKRRFYQLKGSRQGLFNFDAVNLTRETVLIVKGEIPCMLLDQLGFLACAPTGGEGAWHESEQWRTALALAKKVVVGDNDLTGKEKGELRAALLNAELVFPDPQYKDIDEMILAEPERALQVLRSWL